MSRVYNFSAGPAVLPEEVLQEAADEMLDYRGCGMSVMEMSHRSGTYQKIIDEAEADLRQLMVLGIFCHYHRHPATLEIKRNLIDFLPTTDQRAR